MAERPQVRTLGLIVAQPGERELDLDAALGAHQLVPFVDDDQPEVGEELARVVAR